MKFAILILPALLEVALVLALHAQTPTSSALTPEQRGVAIRELRAELKSIAARLDVLESEGHQLLPRGGITADSSALSTNPAAPDGSVRSASPLPQPASFVSGDTSSSAFLRGTTFSFGFAAYYGYNFNEPVGRVNLLRAHDVTPDSFNINQSNLIVKHLPTPTDRTDGRIDLVRHKARYLVAGAPDA